MVLAVVVIALIALGIAGFALTNTYLETRPAPITRTLLISIDFYNATSGSTTYTNARFTPDTLTALDGDTLVFDVTNRDPRPISNTAGRHGFTVDGTAIAITMDPGATISQTVTNVREGVYRFYCQLHTAHLSGQLVVVD